VILLTKMDSTMIFVLMIQLKWKVASSIAGFLSSSVLILVSLRWKSQVYPWSDVLITLVFSPLLIDKAYCMLFRYMPIPHSVV
jgi:hypothetical protein